ncbi:hypothetical protein ACQ4LE_006283 [Meloidogyne hapla]
MDYIDLVESSPEQYDDHRNSAFQMEGSRTVKSERSGIRMEGWRSNNDQNSLSVPGGFGYARSRSRIDDYTDSFGRVESTQFFNRPTNGNRFFENRLSEGGGRDTRGIFERESRLVQSGSERGEELEKQDAGGYFSSDLNQQLLHRSARYADNNDLSQQSATTESSMKRQSLPVMYGNRKRQFFDDQNISNKSAGINSLQTNESHISTGLAPKQPRFSFVSAVSNARFIPLSDRFETEMMATVSPLEKETKFLVFEMRQETNFINSLDPPINVHLNHSKRLLKGEINKLEESYNSEWLELDNKRIKICRYVLVPNYRYPKINFVGRLIGVKGLTLQKICKKYKCFLSIQGAHSTKDRSQEIELLNSGDPRYAHFAAPLHIRIDVFSVPHIAHMRMAAVLNLLHRALIPGNDFDLEAFLEDVDLQQNKESKGSPPTENELNRRYDVEAANLKGDFEEIKKYEKHQAPKVYKIDSPNELISADNIPTQSTDIIGGDKNIGMIHGRKWSGNEIFDNRGGIRKELNMRRENGNSVVYNIDDDDDSVFQ